MPPTFSFDRSAFGKWASDPVWIAMQEQLSFDCGEWKLMELFGGLSTAYIAMKHLGLNVRLVFYCDSNPKLKRCVRRKKKNDYRINES